MGRFEKIATASGGSGRAAGQPTKIVLKLNEWNLAEALADLFQPHKHGDRIGVVTTRNVDLSRK